MNPHPVIALRPPLAQHACSPFLAGADPAPRLDADLIARYDINGPRYTSYPTAVSFTPQFDAAAYATAAALSNRSASPLSIYVHVPFCASPCFYCGCNKVITRDHSRAETYLQYLYREIELQAALFDRSRVVEQLHLGGGTPTFLSPTQLALLVAKLGEQFTLSDDVSTREFSIEIDPRTLETHSLRALAAIGFNRLSLGVQDFDPAVQDAVNRRQSPEQTLEAIAEARRLGFRSVSVDLIYGLPLQTVPSFRRTLEQVISARPDRLAVYGYAHMPQMFKPQQRIIAAQLPNATQRVELLTLTVQMLSEAGYVYIGMDHFALANDELVRARQSRTLHRNFQGYSTKAECDLIGLGVSAIGSVAHSYAQNAKGLKDYYAMLDTGRLPIQRGLTMTDDDQLRHTVIQQVMCYMELDFSALSHDLHVCFTEYFAASWPALRRLHEDGLIDLTDDRLVVRPEGRLLLRHVAMAFDAHLPQVEARTFSKAI